MGGPQHVGALLAEGRRQGGFVQNGVQRPVLGIGQLGPEIVLTLLPRLQLAGNGLEEGPDLVRIEPSAGLPEGVPGHVAGA